MIKMKYILVPVTLGLFFAACNNEPKGPSQEEMDKMVSDKVEKVKEQLKADCDTRFNEAVKMQADSMLAAMPAAVVKTPAPVKVPVKAPIKTPIKTPPTVKTPPPPPNTNLGKNDNVSGTNMGKKDNANATKPAEQGQNLGKKK